MSDWFYAVDGVQYGPVSADDLRRFLAEERLAREDFVWHAALPAWVEAGKVPELAGPPPPLFAVGVPKLVAMYLLTFGIYQLYWFYKHWSTIRARDGQEMWPVARALFAFFFFHDLVTTINHKARAYGIEGMLPAGGLTALFVIATLMNRFDNALFLLALAAVIPLVVVQSRVNEINTKAAPLADRNARLRGANWIVIVVGSIFVALILIGTFIDAQP